MAVFKNGNYGGSIDTRLKLIDNQIGAAATQQGGSVTDPSVYDAPIGSLQSLLQTYAGNEKVSAKIYAAINKYSNAQLKVSSSGSKTDITQKLADWKTLKTTIAQQYSDKPASMIFNLKIAADATKTDLLNTLASFQGTQDEYSQLESKINSALFSNSSGDLTNMSSNGLNAELEQYNTIYNSMNFDESTGNYIGVKDKNVLKQYGLYGQFDGGGNLVDVNLQTVKANDDAKKLFDSSKYGLGFYAEKAGTSGESAVDSINVPKNDSFFDTGNAKVKQWTPDLFSSDGKTVYKKGNDGVYHQVDTTDPTQFSPTDKARVFQGVTAIQLSDFQKAGAIGKDWKGYISDATAKAQQASQPGTPWYQQGFFGKLQGLQEMAGVVKKIPGALEGVNKFIDQSIKDTPAPQTEVSPKETLSKNLEYVSGAGRYLGNKIVQAGQNIFKGGMANADTKK